MNRTGIRRATLLALSALVVCGVKVWADGIPTVTPLAYSGVLQDSVGNPISTAQSIQLTLWDDAAANSSANQKCTTPTQSVTPDSQGRFRIVLDQGCFDAVRTNPNLWVQLQVGSTVLPRNKLNAVPYAIEAAKAGRVVLGANGTSFTTDGLYCGASANQTGAWTASAGALVGYRAAKLLCEQTCSSRTAHACSANEAMMSHVARLSLPSISWLAAPGASVHTEGGVNPTFVPKNDCAGHTVSDPNIVGSTWLPSPGMAGTGYCNDSLPIACCD